MSDLTSNLEKLSGYLERFKSTGVSHHINGKNLWSKNGDTFQSVSPVDESFICDVAKGVPKKSHWQLMPRKTHFLHGVI